MDCNVLSFECFILLMIIIGIAMFVSICLGYYYGMKQKGGYDENI